MGVRTPVGQPVRICTYGRMYAMHAPICNPLYIYAQKII